MLFYVEHGLSRIPAFGRGEKFRYFDVYFRPLRLTLTTSRFSANSAKTWRQALQGAIGPLESAIITMRRNERTPAVHKKRSLYCIQRIFRLNLPPMQHRREKLE